MKILILNMFYYPIMLGGTEHSLKLLAEKMVQAGHIVAIATYDGRDLISNEKIVNGVLVYRMNKPVFMKKAFHKKTSLREKLSYYLGKYWNLDVENQFIKILNKYQPDVVHTNNFFPASLWKIAANKNIRVVHTMRDYFLLDPRSQLDASPHWIVKLHRYYEKYYANKYVDVVTAPSKFIMDAHICKGYFKKIQQNVIYNAIDLQLDETIQIIHDKQKRKSKEIRFCYVGALNETKGFHILLDAFRNIDNGNIYLEICGGGKLQKELRDAQEIKKNLIYHGKLSVDELKEIYIKCDVLIVPSVWEEPFGRVVIEGMQYGLPVIGSNRGGIKEIIDKTHAGEIYQYDSTEELRQKINNFSRRTYLQSFYNCIADMLPLYAVSNQIGQFQRVYEQID